MSYYSQAREYHEQGNHEKAYQLYEAGVANGEEKCYYGIALFLKRGYFVAKDEAHADKLFTEHYDSILQLAEAGDAEAMLIVAFYYLNGFGTIKENIRISNEWKQKAAEQGNSSAQLQLGYMYHFGKGVEKDLAKAVEWYQKSAEQGDSEGQWRLGGMYENGDGVEKDLVKAVEWYQKSAEQGDSTGQWRLGNMHLYGQGVCKSVKQAIEWYEKGAIDPCSQIVLGSMYEEGFEGIPKDYEKAVKWYRASAEQHFSWGEDCLAEMYEQGLGVEQSSKLAVEWWLKAVAHEDAFSGAPAYKLGYAYYDGFGVERDLKKAKEYFEKAIELEYNCTYALNMVKSELGEADTHNAMREYAENLLNKHISLDKIYPQISKDLQTDFGATWEMTTRDTKKFLETGMFTYFSLYSLGPHIYGNMDFSASITPMFKALEKELGQYLYTGYIEYLKAQGISPNSFSGKRTFLTRVGENEYAFKDPADTDEFTLGGLHLTVGLFTHPAERKGESAKPSIDASMLSYLQTLFKKDAFGEAKWEREITNYIVSLTQEVKSIADSFRNPAAHADAMKCQKAEVCGNYIIKVRRLLIDFLEKIK